MIRIGVLSDTHGFLPSQVFQHFQDVDEIWHLGDIGNLDVLTQLEQFKPLRAVYGNIDGGEIRLACSHHLHFKLGHVSFLMIHIGGYPPKYNAETLALLNELKPDVMLCGHSHILKIMPDPPRNLLHINPGACGNHGWHKVNTLLRFDIENGRLNNLKLIEWDRKAIEK